MSAQRHFKWLLAAGIILVLLLVGGGVLLLRQYLRKTGEKPSVVAVVGQATDTLPPSRKELVDFGRAYGRDGDWRRAFECFRPVVEAGNATEWEWSWATGSALAAGETNVCIEFCRQMLDSFGQQNNPAVAERCAKQCLSIPGMPAELLERAAERADYSIGTAPNNRWRQLAKGMAEYRRGHWSESLDVLRFPERTGDIEIAVQAWAFGAMARHQLGDAAGARKALAEVNRRLQAMVRMGELGDPRNNTWDNCARALVVRAEAECLIHGREVSPALEPATVAQNRRTWQQVLEAIDSAEAMAKQEQWREASEKFAAVLRHPAFHWENLELKESIVAQKLAVSFLLAGDDAAHRQLTASLLDREPEGLTSTMQERYASAILLRSDPLTPEQAARAENLARLAYEDPGAGRNPWRLLLRGMADYRAGRYEEVIPALSRIQFPGDPLARGRAFAFLSLALHQLGRTSEAAQIWSEAEKARQSGRGAGWWNIGAYELAAREYRSLTHAPAKAVPPQ